jgi:hypothetical protein
VVQPEIEKSSPIADPSLACSIGKSYGFVGFTVVKEFLLADDSAIRLGCMAHNLKHYSGQCGKEEHL